MIFGWSFIHSMGPVVKKLFARDKTKVVLVVDCYFEDSSGALSFPGILLSRRPPDTQKRIGWLLKRTMVEQSMGNQPKDDMGRIVFFTKATRPTTFSHSKGLGSKALTRRIWGVSGFTPQVFLGLTCLFRVS